MSENLPGDVFQECDETLVPFYKRFHKVFLHAKDHFLYDSNGREYIDLAAGISVTSFGHCNKQVNDAIKKQLDEILHVSNLFYIPGQAVLSRMISEKSFDGKTFFCNSGAESNETALKIARMTGNAKSPGKNRVKGLDPLLPNVEFVEFDSAADLEKKFGDDVCAVFMEAIQGESGIRPVSGEFAAKVSELAAKHDALIVMDEVQCGLGRAGKYFGYQWYDLQPHIITMAKSLGNGIPIGAVHVVPEVADKMQPGMHASTFGGNYVAVAAAVAVMKLLDDELLAHINEMGDYLESKFEALDEFKSGSVGEVRRKGLMIGADIVKRPVAEVIEALLDKGFVTLRAGENTLRLLPPYTITPKEIDAFGDALADVL